METSQTPNVAHASGPVSKVHTSEPLGLHDLFQSRSLLLQYLSGMMDADGSIGINRKDAERFQGMVRFSQSNLAYLTAINAEFGYTGYISTHYAAGTDANVNEGRFSNGKMRQTLTFLGKAAVEVAEELAPFTVTKTQHMKVLLEMMKQSDGLLTRAQYWERMKALDRQPEDSIIEVRNITPAWLAGMFDGDGGLTVLHNKESGRSRLELNITQSKCPKLLLAIQALYPGTMASNPHRLKWVAANIIPTIYKALNKHLVLKKQKLNTLLQHLFDVDISKDPIKGAGRSGAFSCPNPTEGWTAENWRDYLHEPLLPWSR